MLWSFHATGNYSREWIGRLFHKHVLSQYFSLDAFFRWLDRSEDDGQIVRELLPFSDGQRLFSKYEERWSPAEVWPLCELSFRAAGKLKCNWSLNVLSVCFRQMLTITSLSRRGTSPGAARTPTCSSSCMERKATPVRRCCWCQTITLGITLRRVAWISSLWKPLILDRWQQ